MTNPIIMHTMNPLAKQQSPKHVAMNTIPISNHDMQLTTSLTSYFNCQLAKKNLHPKIQINALTDQVKSQLSIKVS